jgi:hypothetical protein
MGMIQCYLPSYFIFLLEIIITKKQFIYMSIRYQLHYSFACYSSMILKGELLLPHFNMGFSWTLFSFRRRRQRITFSISSFRRDLNIVYVLLAISPASICSLPTFRNHVSIPSSKAWNILCLRLKMEMTHGSETSANYKLTPGKYTKSYTKNYIDCRGILKCVSVHRKM